MTAPSNTAEATSPSASCSGAGEDGVGGLDGDGGRVERAAVDVVDVADGELGAAVAHDRGDLGARRAVAQDGGLADAGGPQALEDVQDERPVRDRDERADAHPQRAVTARVQQAVGDDERLRG